MLLDCCSDKNAIYIRRQLNYVSTIGIGNNAKLYYSLQMMSWEKAGKNLHVSASLLRGASVLHAKHWSKPAAELNKPGPAQVGAISKAQKSKNT